MIVRRAHSISCNVSFEDDEWEDAASNLRRVPQIRTTLEQELSRRGIECDVQIDENGCVCLKPTHVETDDADGLRADLDLVADHVERFRLAKAPIIYMIDDSDHLFCWWFRNGHCVEGDVALSPQLRKRGR